MSNNNTANLRSTLDPGQIALTFNSQAISILSIEHDFPNKDALQTAASAHLLKVFEAPVPRIG